jgi:hypothetical protein
MRASKKAGATGKILQNPSKSLAEVELLREHSILLMHP